MPDKKIIWAFVLGWLFSVVFSPTHLTGMFRSKG